MLGLMLAAFLAGAPFAAHAAGSWAYATSVRQAQAEQAHVHQMQATLLQAAPIVDLYDVPDVDARWLAPDGRMHVGRIVAPNGSPAGSTVKVWINTSGQLADRPLRNDQVVGRVQLAVGCAVSGLAITLVVVGWLVRWFLVCRRMAAWDADWLTYGPRWTSRR